MGTNTECITSDMGTPETLQIELANGGQISDPDVIPGCMLGRLLAGYRLFTTRDRESSKKNFFRFFRTQSFLCKTKAKMLKISVGLP